MKLTVRLHVATSETAESKRMSRAVGFMEMTCGNHTSKMYARCGCNVSKLYGSIPCHMDIRVAVHKNRQAEAMQGALV